MSEIQIEPEPNAVPPPAPAEIAEPVMVPPGAPPPAGTVPVTERRRRGIFPALGILAVLALAAGELYLWHLYQTLPPAAPDLSSQLASLQSEVAALQKAMPNAAQTPASALQAVPAPTPAPTPAQPPTPTPAQPPAQGPLAAVPAPPAPADADFANRLGTLNALVDALQTQFITDHNELNTLQTASAGLPKLSGDVAALQGEAAADHAALATLQSTAASLGKLTGRMTVLNRLQTARMALDAGQPVGNVPNAPPALAKFAVAPPPTEAALVLAFPAAARAAQSASVAGAAHGTYWSSVKARLENLVTISDGDHVIIGAPAAAVISQAQALLNAGDLAGAVAALNTLSATTQAAMGDWLGQARDLLAARAAIAAMAAQA